MYPQPLTLLQLNMNHVAYPLQPQAQREERRLEYSEEQGLWSLRSLIMPLWIGGGSYTAHQDSSASLVYVRTYLTDDFPRALPSLFPP